MKYLAVITSFYLDLFVVVFNPFRKKSTLFIIIQLQGSSVLRSCQIVSGQFQVAYRQLSGSCQAIVRQLSGRCLAVVRQMFGSCHLHIRWFLPTLSSRVVTCQTVMQVSHKTATILWCRLHSLLD